MQVDYSSYQAQRNNTRNTETNNRPKVVFLNTLLTNDGDVAFVRFPYRSLNDFKIDYTHTVKFPEDKYARRVCCDGPDCMLCEQGLKRDARVFLKMIAYVPSDAGKITPVVAVWDRATPFIDIDIKSKIEECADNAAGALCDNVVKIKATGVGTARRYSLSIMYNKSIYNAETYSADFSILDNIQPERFLSKTIAQYKKAIGATDEVPAAAAQPVEKKAEPVNTTPAYTPKYQAPAPQERAAIETPADNKQIVDDIPQASTATPSENVPRTAGIDTGRTFGGARSTGNSNPYDAFSNTNTVRRPIRHTF